MLFQYMKLSLRFFLRSKGCILSAKCMQEEIRKKLRSTLLSHGAVPMMQKHWLLTSQSHIQCYFFISNLFNDLLKMFLYYTLKCVKILFLSFRMDQICVLYEKYFFENFLCLFIKSEKLRRYDILFCKFELMN